MKIMSNIIYGDKEARLENVVAYPLDGYVRLKLTYTYEKEDGVYRIIIPNVSPMIPTDYVHKIVCNECSYDKPAAYMDVDGVNLPIHDGSIPEFDNINHVYLAEKLVSRKVREMTLEEIEERLGYKVKIINKGEEK